MELKEQTIIYLEYPNGTFNLPYDVYVIIMFNYIYFTDPVYCELFTVERRIRWSVSVTVSTIIRIT